MNLNGKAVVITGGEGPLGRAVSKKFLAEGAKMVMPIPFFAKARVSSVTTWTAPPSALSMLAITCITFMVLFPNRLFWAAKEQRESQPFSFLQKKLLEMPED